MTDKCGDGSARVRFLDVDFRSFLAAISFFCLRFAGWLQQTAGNHQRERDGWWDAQTELFSAGLAQKLVNVVNTVSDVCRRHLRPRCHHIV